MMLVAKISIAFLLVPTASQQACALGVDCVLADDVTSLLQSNVDLKIGVSRKVPGVAKIQDVQEHGVKNSNYKENMHEAYEGATSPEEAEEQEKQTRNIVGSLLAADETQWLDARLWLGATGMVHKGLAEFIATTLFVFIGCGTAMAVPDKGGKLFHVSLTFGFAITALAYTIGHYSGGQINCAVSFGLLVTGNLSITQALVNTVFQLLGSVFGSFLTMSVFSDTADQTDGLGTNAVSPEFTTGQAIIAEIMGTFLLVYVVLETAVNPATLANRSQACLAVGIAVFLAHSVLIPVDGCSINPSRSFGPMLVRKMFRPGKDTKYIDDHWIFWVGPLAGAGLAGAAYTVMHG